MATLRTLPAGRNSEGLSLIIPKPATRREPVAHCGGFVPLRTTTQSPPVARRRIRRERLLLRLQGAAAARLILIKAPGGYGKTTLAVDWSAELESAGQRVAWVRAERENSESGIFLQYVACALEQACPGAGRPALAIYEANSLPPSHAVLAALVNALAETGEEICLLVDDYHLVDSPEIGEAIVFFLRHAPRHFRIALTTRELPDLPLGTLRARGELFEVDAGELRFSLEETGILVQAECSQAADETTVNALQRETGGWAAALRLACSFIHGGIAADQCLRSRRGGSHALDAYLREVLGRLPRDLHDFMLATSILKALSPDVCHAVSGRANSDEMLDLLIHRHQLVDLGADEPPTWTYHPLVADFLRQRLHREAPERFSELQRKAAHWHFAHGRMADAIRHALAAGDGVLATEWTQQCAMRLIMEGKIGTVLGWRRWLPKELTRNQLPLRLALGWSMILAARREEAVAWIDEIAADIAAGLPDPEGRAGRECLAIRTCALALGDASAASLALARRYLEAPLPQPWIHNAVGNCMHFACLMAGRHAEAAAVPWEDLTGDPDTRATSTEIYRLCLRGLSFSQRLLFAEARSCYQEASLVAARDRGPNSSLNAIPTVLLAHQAYELDRIDEAEGMLRGRLDAINASGFLDCELRGYVLLTRIAWRNDDLRLAHELLDQGERIAGSEGWPRMQAGLLAERLRLFVDAGDLTSAAGCLARLETLVDAGRGSAEPADAHVRGYRQLASACLDIRSGRFDAAVDTLEGAWQAAIEAERRDFAVRAGTVQAAAMLAGGRAGSALARFREVIELAAPAGLIRTIVDGGPEVGALIDSARREFSGQAGDAVVACHLNRLASACAVSQQGVAVRPLANIPGASPLTAREANVLRLIASGQSNKRIASALEVSPETVKSHIKSIFAKLGVDNRMQAVTSGRRQGYCE